MLAIGLQKGGVIGVAVVGNSLLVGHTLSLSSMLDTVCASRALIDKADLEGALGNVWLAEIVGKQTVRNADVLLAHANRQLVVIGFNQAGRSEQLTRAETEDAEAKSAEQGGYFEHGRLRKRLTLILYLCVPQAALKPVAVKGL